MEEGDDLRLSRGEMFAEEAGVESMVAISAGRAVVVIARFGVGEEEEERKKGQGLRFVRLTTGC